MVTKYIIATIILVKRFAFGFSTKDKKIITLGIAMYNVVRNKSCTKRMGKLFWMFSAIRNEK